MNRERGRRLVIVDQVMSAGGVERVLRGLTGALLQIPEARAWDITLLLSPQNSAGKRCEWPAELVAPNVHLQWLGEHSWLSRLLDPLARAQRYRDIPGSSLVRRLPAFAVRKLGPPAWRAWAGDPASYVARYLEQFDVAYFTWPLGMAVPQTRIPVVTTPADFNFKHFLPVHDRNRILTERHMSGWLRRADRLLLTSEFVLDELRGFYPEHASKAEVVRLGVDATADAPPPDEVSGWRRARQLPPEFVLVAGWVAPHKNQLVVVDAMAALRARGVGVPVVFVGPNAEQLASPVKGRDRTLAYVEQVRAALDRQGFQHGRDFHALGYVTDRELAALYRLASAFVLPSLYEGFGLPGLEALQAACPTILAAIPPLLEQNRLLGDVAPTFDPRDPGALAARIEHVLTRREAARADARRAAERVPRVFDWRETARGYLRAFAIAVDGAAAARGRGHAR